jgi:hypothetical protein
LTERACDRAVADKREFQRSIVAAVAGAKPTANLYPEALGHV